VHYDHSQAKKLDGTKIRVSGTVTMVKGLKNQSQELDTNGSPYENRVVPGILTTSTLKGLKWLNDVVSG